MNEFEQAAYPHRWTSR